MDFSDETPERWWVADFSKHTYPVFVKVCRCGTLVDPDYAVPMLGDKVMCANCATDEVKGHPITAEYLKWLQDGDLRWWSPWICQCKGCGIDVP